MLQFLFSENGVLELKGSSSRNIVLNSPIAIKEADFTCVRLHYSLQKSTNVDVTLSMWAQYYDVPLVPGVFDWTNKNCTSCSVEVDVYGDEQHATMVNMSTFVDVSHFMWTHYYMNY